MTELWTRFDLNISTAFAPQCIVPTSRQERPLALKLAPAVDVIAKAEAADNSVVQAPFRIPSMRPTVHWLEGRPGCEAGARTAGVSAASINVRNSLRRLLLSVAPIVITEPLANTSEDTRVELTDDLNPGELVANAFNEFRAIYPAKEPMKPVAGDHELKLISSPYLSQLKDGRGPDHQGNPPEIEAFPEGVQLWAVRPEDVVVAPEKCDFASEFPGGVIKHTNLTGGNLAHCGGELIVLDEDTLAVNGASGRYGPTSEAEMLAVAKAFRNSGYGVWYYAYDDESGEPFRFGSRLPEWLP